MNILISQLSQVPIYEQLESQLRQNILSGVLQPQEMLPSIRSMAKELNIGIITVKRAYDDLCTEGLLVSIQGRGVFVADVDVTKVRQSRREQLIQKLSEIKQFCDASAISKEDVIAEWNRLYEEENYE